MKARLVAGLVAASLALATPLVAKFEGQETEAYLDPVGIVTICYGHTETAKLGQRKAPDECKALLERDLEQHVRAAASLVQVPVTPTQLAALGSLTYNIGPGNLAKSTLLRKLNAGDYCGAGAEFPRWNKAKGKVLRGLIARRLAEQALFMENLWLTCRSRPVPVKALS